MTYCHNYYTCDEKIGLPLSGCPVLLSLVWLQTELDSTQSYYHHKLIHLWCWYMNLKTLFSIHCLALKQAKIQYSLEHKSKLLVLNQTLKNWQVSGKQLIASFTYLISIFIWRSMHYCPGHKLFVTKNLHQVSNQFFLDHDRSLPRKTLRKNFSFFKQKSNV